MNGAAEVARLKQRLDATFSRVSSVSDDPEVQSDFAKYLCVLVSGYLENAVRELVQEHARQQSSPSVQKFVESSTRRFTNANCEKLKQLLGRFDTDWVAQLEISLIDEREEAVNSIVALKNSIAHGRSVGITFVRVKEYYENIQTVVQEIEQLCVRCD